jgi:tetratricopeptide (TPR) repeat protein
MKREQLAFLVGGFAFGILFGFALFHGIQSRPELADTSMAGNPGGSMAPAQSGAPASGGAPMVARINELKRELQQSPKDINLLVDLADIYHQAAMWEQAAGYYERALELEPAQPDLLTNLGLCFGGMGEYDRALEAFDRAHRENPQHWQSLFNTVIVAARDAGELDVALEAMEAMEAIEPRPADLDPVHLKQLREWLEQSQAARKGAGQS